MDVSSDVSAEAGIYAIPLPTSFAVGPVNSYLIEDDPLTLVDAGPNSATAFAALEDGLAALGHRVEDLGLILVTHQHLDHMGLVGLLARRSGAELAALNLLQPWLANYGESINAQQRYVNEIMATNGVPRDIRLVVRAMGRQRNGWGAPADVTMPLTPGEELELRDRTLRILHRPGHSPSDTVFLDGERRIMIGGDHLLGHISSNPVITRPLTGSPYPRPQTLVTYIASMQATAADRVDVVLPGHGTPVHDHRELIRTRLQAPSRAPRPTARADRGAATKRPRAGPGALGRRSDQPSRADDLRGAGARGSPAQRWRRGRAAGCRGRRHVRCRRVRQYAGVGPPHHESAGGARRGPHQGRQRAPLIGGSGPSGPDVVHALPERGFETTNLHGRTDEVPLPDRSAESLRVRPAGSTRRTERTGGLSGDRPARRHGHSNRAVEPGRPGSTFVTSAEAGHLTEEGT